MGERENYLATSDKVKFKSIEEFLALLPEERNDYYYEKLNDLEKWLNKGQLDEN